MPARLPVRDRSPQAGIKHQSRIGSRARAAGLCAALATALSLCPTLIPPVGHGSAHAAIDPPCIDYAALPHWLATREISGGVYGLARSGNLLYLAAGGGLVVYDLSDLRDPQRVGAFPIGRLTLDALVLYRDRVLLSTDAGTLELFDVSDPANPERIHTISVGSSVPQIARRGSTIVAAAGRAGLWLGRFDDLGAIRFDRTVAVPGRATGVVVQGDLAYVACGAGGLAVVHLAATPGPRIVGSLPIAGEALGVAIHEQTLLIVSSEAGAVFCDLADPIDPVPLQQLPAESGGASKPSLTAGRAGIPAASGVFQSLVRGSDGRWRTSGTLRGAAAIHCVDLGSDAVVLGHDDGISTANTPLGNGASTRDQMRTRATPTALSVSGRSIGIAEQSLGIEVLDLTEEGQIIRQSWFDEEDAWSDLVYRPPYVFAVGPHGLSVIDFSDRLAPEVHRVIDRPLSTVALWGERLAVGDESNVLLYDVEEPTRPRLQGEFRSEAGVRDLLLGARGEIVSLGSGFELRNWESSDGWSPIATVRRPGDPSLGAFFGLDRLAIASRLHAIDRTTSVELFDLANPSQPSSFGSVHLAGRATSIASAPPFILVTLESTGLVLVDCSDPTHPTIAGTVAASGGQIGVGASRIAATMEDQLMILDAPCGAAARDGIEDLRLFTEPGRNRVEWNADPSLWTGFLIERAPLLATGEAPFVALEDGRLFPAHGPLAFDDYAVRPGHGYRYRVVGLRPDGQRAPIGPLTAFSPRFGSFFLAPPMPQPAREQVALRYYLPEPREVEITIHDVGGRIVHRLVRGQQESGGHLELWNGRDARGNRVPSGIYFADLQAGRDRERARIVWIR